MPVSSTAHVVFFKTLVGIDAPFIFDILIQSGSAIALCCVYRKLIFSCLRYFLVSYEFRNLSINLFSAFCPLVFAALLVDKNFTESMEQYSAFLLIFVGVVIVLVDKFFYRPNTHSLFDIKISQAIFVGFFQTFAIIPGVSRSGSTILGAILCGMSRKIAIKFSFILAIPSILSASVYAILFQERMIVDYNFLFAWVGAFILTFAFIKKVVSFIEKNGLMLIGLYRIIFGIMSIFILKFLI